VPNGAWKLVLAVIECSLEWHSVLTVCHELSGDDPDGIFAGSSSLQPRSALRLRMQSFPAASTATALTSCTAYGLRSPTHPHSV
jgi:hypothetical protein